MAKKKYDFSGWATRTNVMCSDGRVILPDAFAHNDGVIVPLLWNHNHNEPMNVLGHALLENCPEGVYAYGSFNDTENGKQARYLVDHGDIVALSIFANDLKHSGQNVTHGEIREVSLVLAGANPKAFIDNISKDGSMIEHSDDATGEAIIYFDEPIHLTHSAIEEHDADDDNDDTETNVDDENSSSDDELMHADKNDDAKNQNEEDSEETVGQVFDTLSEKQKNVVYAMIAMAIENSEVEHSGIEDDTEEESNTIVHSDEPNEQSNNEEFEGGTTVKHNVFEFRNKENAETTLTHAQQMEIIADGKRYGSLRDSALQHGIAGIMYTGSAINRSGDSLQHGITNTEYLFPEANATDIAPIFITRDQTWVTDLMNGFRHTPFSRIKSVFADLTTEDARAKGYIKGNLKVEEVFALLKRTTTPTTVYKKQKMDRDDVVDITSFDVIAWLKSEMRLMLDEEIARAALVGDGRLAASDDKVNESCIRPIWTDAELFTIRGTVSIAAADATDADKTAKAFIRACIKSRKNYKGSGSPNLYTTEDVLTDCLLLEDTTGRRIYDSVDHLATALRVGKIITVPVMENLSRVVDSVTRTLMGIVVNPKDYSLGADKGGAINMFDDFDIDYNQQKYLIETRASGALTVPYSAIALEKVISA